MARNLKTAAKKARPNAAKRRKPAQPKALSLNVPAIKERFAAIPDASDGLPRPEHARLEVVGKSADGQVTTIDLYDVIGGYGADAKSFRQAIKAVKTKTLKLRINSPGGYVFDGIAMYNDLLDFRRAGGRVEVEVTGLAASAASLIAMAGDSIAIADNAFLMIHNAWVGVVGDRNEIGKVAAVLERVDSALARTYSARTGMSVEEVGEMMDDETWLDGPAALELGFADKSGDIEIENALRFDLSAYFNVPAVCVSAAKGTTEIEPSAEEPTEDGASLSQFIAEIRRTTAALKGSAYVPPHTPANPSALPRVAAA